ncbi:hypothetical protein INT43_001824 [Umbelopsis isabellina]|uniref:NAD-capped RNA hydrolase NUDT12 n=1 Tax=Mortierella isabellina TaxID=91625 RepID=A0A8H7PS86_MORIS|nr:hypothetical protein INT43_001824 [Umbelopsis isabellina]
MSSTTIFEAAAEGDIAYLQAHTSEISTKNDRGWTPLHFAARYGQLEVVKYLKEQNVPTDVVNSEGKTAYAMAEFWGFDEVAQVLKPDDKPDDKPMESTTQEDNEVKHKFRKNNVNYFAGSPLNRYSWFRSDKAVLSRLLRAQSARFVLLSELKPLIDDSQEHAPMHFGGWDEVQDIIGDPYNDDDTAKNLPILVFLGIDETKGLAEEGVAYWALDVTPKGERKSQMEQFIQDLSNRELQFYDPRSKAFALDGVTAAIYAQARSMVDWNNRNQFCPACGRNTVSAEAGHKRVCPPQPGPHAEQVPCISAKGVHNFAYPRTDPVIIVCVIHPTEDRILLGRQAAWPKRQYSCLAGFVEAGESVEEAVRREVHEESGVHISNVVFHSSQPWPFPNSLMMGFIAQASSTEIKLADKELENAAWYTRGEVLAAISPQANGPFNVPPGIAIAYQLIKSWATEKEWGGNGLNAKM